MNAPELKEILVLYRPGAGDENDPEMAAALREVERDPNLKAWFDQQRIFNTALREKLRQVEPPPHLKQKILAGRPAARVIVWWRRPEILALAASVVLVGCLLVFSMFSASREENRLAHYRSRMVKYALTQYRMDIATNNMREIRAYLSGKGGHGDYALSEPLNQLPGAGCALLKWQNHPVSLVCFRLGEKDWLWLFVIDRQALDDAPATAAPQLAAVGKMATAAWSQAGKTYLLMAIGNESLIQKLL